MRNRRQTSLPSRLKGFAISLLLLAATTACVLSYSSPQRAPRTQEPEQVSSEGITAAIQTEAAAQSTQLSFLATQVQRLEMELENQSGMISYLATRGPAVPPSPVVPPDPTPYLPLRGGLEIEEGKCCVGGIAGETTTVQVSFFAESPYGEVTSMRVFAGNSPRSPQEFDQIPWQPFLPGTSFEVPIVLNWTGFYIQVQFRDALGNLSPVYSDDISVEGMPAPPTPTP